MAEPTKVYVVASAWDYEGWTLPALVTTDRERAIQTIRDWSAPDYGEDYSVYEYTLDGEEGQGDCIANRRRNQKVWVKETDNG